MESIRPIKKVKTRISFADNTSFENGRALITNKYEIIINGRAILYFNLMLLWNIKFVKKRKTIVVDFLC